LVEDEDSRKRKKKKGTNLIFLLSTFCSFLLPTSPEF